jgi:hypothetical protein
MTPGLVSAVDVSIVGSGSGGAKGVPQLPQKAEPAGSWPPQFAQVRSSALLNR